MLGGVKNFVRRSNSTIILEPRMNLIIFLEYSDGKIINGKIVVGKKKN